MSFSRRDFMKFSAGAAGAAILNNACSGTHNTASMGSDPISTLKPMTDDVVPITDEERWERIEKAQRLMIENSIDAVYMEGGSSMFYYTGAQWWNSERMFALVLPAKGEPGWVCPAFELDRAMEQIRFGEDIRTWEEHESPYRRGAEIL